jgi:phosphate transport system protein
LFGDVVAYMAEDGRRDSAGTQLLFIARDIERIGDLATDVAEMACYLVLGEPVEDGRPKADRTKSIRPAPPVDRGGTSKGTPVTTANGR